MGKRRRIGLKYCGGCNPLYDRVQAVVSVRKRLKDKIELVSYEDRDAEGTLVVTGCPTACVDLKPFVGHPIWVVTSLRDVERFVETMSNVQATQKDNLKPLSCM
jgi:hypothetical protein